jgi:FkbM family methyltransferase
MLDWSHAQLTEEYHKRVSALQYTIGERDRLKALWMLVAESLTQASPADIAKVMKLVTSSPSERFQDLFALLLSGVKSEGFFVEFGACDGRAASNTWLLEREFGWTGILAEPGVFWHEMLKNNRSCTIDTRCVSIRTGEALEFHEAEMAGVSSLDANHQFIGQIKSTYSVQTVSLMDLLREHRAPAYIDFMSVDTEGHELEALQKFDFDAYRFGFLSVEQHASVPADRSIVPLLNDAGYEILFPRHEDTRRPPSMQITGVDLFFVPRGHPAIGISERLWQSV